MRSDLTVTAKYQGSRNVREIVDRYVIADQDQLRITDEPTVVLPAFSEFEMTSIPHSGKMGHSLPDYVRDFEILRRADDLAICNSSFSRMAAILAQPSQQCFLP